MSIADKLTYLNTTKTLLRDAIRRAGHYLPDAATFRSYPYALLPDEASLNLDFARGEYVAHNWLDGTVSRVGLSNIVTTTRASGGGYFDHLGVYQWAANNEPRIDHDPATLSTSTSSVTLASGAVTLVVTVTYPVGAYVRATADAGNWMAGRVTASTGSSVTIWADRVVGSGTFASWTVIRVRGLLVEESRTNLLARSASPSTWAKASGVTLEATTTRLGMIFGQLGASGTFQSVGMAGATVGATVTVAAGSVTKSFYLIPGTLTAIQDRTPSVAGGALLVPINIVSGVPVAGTANGSTAGWAHTGTKITKIENDLYRIEITYTCPATSTASGAITLTQGAAGPFVNGVSLGGIQLEQGASPSSHTPTTTAQVTRAADQCTITSLTDWLGTDNTLIIEHNAPAGRVLLSSGSTVLATSQGPGKLAIAYTATETRICQAGGSVTTSGPLTFDTSLRLLASATAYANAHVSVVQSIPRALSNTELQRITA